MKNIPIIIATIILLFVFYSQYKYINTIEYDIKLNMSNIELLKSNIYDLNRKTDKNEYNIKILDYEIYLKENCNSDEFECYESFLKEKGYSIF